MEFHEYAGIYDLLEGAEFDALVEDIKANGLCLPIILHTDGRILDGRNRYRACVAAGVAPRYEEWNGEGLACDFVHSLNGPRRHLNQRQTQIAAARFAILRGEEATARSRANLRNSSTPPTGGTEDFGRSGKKAAEQFGVPERTVERTVQVVKGGTPGLIAAFESGKVSVSAAADVATLPKEEQAVIVARGEKEILESAKSIRIEKATIRKVENDKLKAESRAIPLPTGKYRTIVIDPPWDMKKIARDAAPDQVDFDYPTMTLEQIAAFPVASMAHDEAILFCWTTQKYLPSTFAILESWGFKYLSAMVWHKNGGFQPFGLPQYNCEFVLIGRKNGCEFDDTKAFNLCNQWPRREHSRKPDEFYDLVRRVSPGPRIDVFSRESRAGFDQFGNQTEQFGGAA